MSYNYQPTDLIIYKAALRGDWDSVSQIFEQHPELTTKTISPRLETPLMIAVGTGNSSDFVLQLLSVSRYEMYAVDYEGNTALHYAAKVGNIIDAGRLLHSNPTMIRIRNTHGNTPLILAASLGRKNMLQYMLWVTNHHYLSEEGSSNLYTFVGGGDLITLVIQAGFLDIALQIVDMYPDIVLETNFQSQSALAVLATKSDFFPRPRKLGLWSYLVYSLLPVKKSEVIPENKSQKDVDINEFLVPFEKETGFRRFLTGFRRILQYLASPITNIYDIKVKHIQAEQLVNRMCTIIIEKANHEIAWNMLGSTIATAVNYGAYELIEACILAYPSIIWYNFEGFYLFHSAISQRQVQVYNLVYQMSSHKAIVASQLVDKEKENALHVAAKLAPPHRLNITTGAALQMQHELQWFKEIENFVEPSYKEALNKDGKTPGIVFTDEHKNLLKEGQEWMKDTASSCTVVAALIVTMAFAAAFTVPGGNKDDGKPLFLNKGAFMLFIISDAIALFSSSTSVLMFLGILTSRYAEYDFLYALPKRMMIGLVSLFLSLAATLIAFSATLALVLQDKVTWIAAPLVIITSIPVGLFGLLQFPLLMELVHSTYGPSIFRRQNDIMIH